MKKITEFIKRVLSDGIETFRRYKVTLSLIGITTILALFLVDFEDVEFLQHLTIITSLTALLSFTIETYFENKKEKIGFLILAIIMSLITDYIIHLDDLSIKLSLFIVGIYLSITILAFYKISKNANSLSSFLTHVLNNNILLGIASSAINMGVLFIVTIIQTLIFNNTDFELYLKAEILILGIFVIPGEILSLTYHKHEIMKPIRVLINYIILPLVLTATAVIYVYFLKMIFTLNIPSNEVFLIITILFIAAGPTWLMIRCFRSDNKFIRFSTKYLPYIFIPLICLQIFSIGIRLFDHGITIRRYIGIMVLIFEIATVALSILKEEKHLHKLVLVGSTLVLIIFCIPFINMIDISYFSQSHRLTTLYTKNTNFEELDKKQKAQISNIFYYIKYDLKQDDRLPEYIDKDMLDKRGYYYYDEPISLESINYNRRNNKINIEGYKTIEEIEIYTYESAKTVNKLQLDELNIYQDKDKNKEARKAFNKYINHILKAGEVEEEEIILNENTKISISYLYISYDSSTNEITSININGFLIQK